jgi:hypothetical protein
MVMFARRHAPADLSKEGAPVPIIQGLGWAPGSVWTCVKNSPPPGFDPRTAQPVASRYTEYAMTAHHRLWAFHILLSRPDAPLDAARRSAEKVVMFNKTFSR